MNNFKGTAILSSFSEGSNAYLFYFAIRKVTKHTGILYIQYREEKDPTNTTNILVTY